MYVFARYFYRWRYAYANANGHADADAHTHSHSDANGNGRTLPLIHMGIISVNLRSNQLSVISKQLVICIGYC